jgi:Iron-containing redox enzyme
VDRSTGAHAPRRFSGALDQATLFARLDDTLAPPDRERQRCATWPTSARYRLSDRGGRVRRRRAHRGAVVPAHRATPADRRPHASAAGLGRRVRLRQPPRAHSRLHMDLLEELGLSTDLDDHAPTTGPEPLAFVNLFYWLSAQADTPAWFFGALAHLEASIVHGFTCYVAACERLGVVRLRAGPRDRPGTPASPEMRGVVARRLLPRARPHRQVPSP